MKCSYFVVFATAAFFAFSPKAFSEEAITQKTEVAINADDKKSESTNIITSDDKVVEGQYYNMECPKKCVKPKKECPKPEPKKECPKQEPKKECPKKEDVDSYGEDNTIKE